MIAVEHLHVHVGSFELKDLSFEVPQGRFGVLMGKTGTGKTTLLEAICGLKPVVAGIIRLNGGDVTRLKPAGRGIGYVPQDGALFSSMTVREHLAFAPAIRKWERQAIRDRVAELAELLGLTALLDRRPQGLSGGEAQRVALGRALACRPTILCLDEPLSALDEDTKAGLYDLLLSVRQRERVTALYVTHSREDAERLADVRLRLDNGTIVADGG
ncbi:MAG: ABC transporter ATP-binding protein [Lentisphaerae bacterium]|nr:ABC transporter ATP-binding protein [Lentisphaerota bacterium]